MFRGEPRNSSKGGGGVFKKIRSVGIFKMTSKKYLGRVKSEIPVDPPLLFVMNEGPKCTSISNVLKYSRNKFCCYIFFFNVASTDSFICRAVNIPLLM